ncbi:hypothetical protein DFP72DRAFT_1141069 [Ephemerocybe angulata]|uniref:Uncharacterized protein n=1 Tax=Ephemerocybe angulata TaxID=980116 RepID=A0A8H6ID04_9AGAR|nr:hypothetical protein DFP72DRAFT_1141069 [Tulosesus angulatus]
MVAFTNAILPTVPSSSGGLSINDFPLDILLAIFSLARPRYVDGYLVDELYYYGAPTISQKCVCRKWYTILETTSSLYTTLVVQAEYQAGGVITNVAEVQGVMARSGNRLLDVIIVPSFEIDDMEGGDGRDEAGEAEEVEMDEEAAEIGPRDDTRLEATTPFDMPWLFGLGLAARCKSLSFRVALYTRADFFASILFASDIPFPHLENARVNGLKCLHPPIEGVFQAPRLQLLYASGHEGIFDEGRCTIQGANWGNLRVIHFLNAPYLPSDIHTLLKMATSLVDLRIKCGDKCTEPPLELLNNTLEILHIDYDYRGSDPGKMFGVFELFLFSSLSSLSLHIRRQWWGPSSYPPLGHIPSIVLSHPFVESLTVTGEPIMPSELEWALAHNSCLKTLTLGSFPAGEHQSTSILCAWDPAPLLEMLSQSVCPKLERFVMTNAKVSLADLIGFLNRVNSIRVVELQNWWCEYEDWALRKLVETGGRTMTATWCMYSGRRWRGGDKGRGDEEEDLGTIGLGRVDLVSKGGLRRVDLDTMGPGDEEEDLGTLGMGMGMGMGGRNVEFDINGWGLAEEEV